MSQDGGNTFKFIDPNSMAQPADGPDVKFCCDQVVNCMSSIDTFVWLLQYGPQSGDNIQRLAFGKTADVMAGKKRAGVIPGKVQRGARRARWFSSPRSGGSRH